MNGEMFERNMRCIRRRTEAGLERLRREYTVTELSVGELKRFTVAGRVHEVRQFDVAGLGNLVIMINPEQGAMQMDTFMLTPYYKNLPLFTTDYMYFEDRRMFLSELYDLVEEKDTAYEAYIGRFRDNLRAVEALPDMPMPPRWYDSLRPAYAGKVCSPDEDDRFFDLFLKNLETFLEMDRATPLLPDGKRAGKWAQNYEYARRLVEDGGVSTELFVNSLGAELTKTFFYSVFFAPHRYRFGTADRLDSFLDELGPDGRTNRARVKERQRILRRLPETDKGKSVEAGEGFSDGIVTENGRVTGFGIHIYNEDVYPLRYFEITLRGCGLTGCLDLGDERSMIYTDVYRNAITAVRTGYMPAMRILGLQDNRIGALDVSGMPNVQGIDAGKNRLTALDTAQNPELVELYVNDNRLTELDLRGNRKLKYLYCQGNALSELDVRKNPLLRHLNATGNPMKRILALAPQQPEPLPLELTAAEGGCVGLHFFPVYNAQWKETGEWRQQYFAYPDEGYAFAGWFDENGEKAFEAAEVTDAYGASRKLKAVFARRN